MTEADSIVDPDSDDEPERKDSLDVHEEGKGQQIYSLTKMLKIFMVSINQLAR